MQVLSRTTGFCQKTTTTTELDAVEMNIITWAVIHFSVFCDACVRGCSLAFSLYNICNHYFHHATMLLPGPRTEDQALLLFSLPNVFVFPENPSVLIGVCEDRF